MSENLKGCVHERFFFFLLSLSAVKVDHYISDERGWLRNYLLLDKTRTDGRNDCLLSRLLTQLFVCLSDLLECVCVCLSVCCLCVYLCVSVHLSFCLFVFCFPFWFTLFSSFQTKQQAPGGRVISSTAEAEQALTNLESLRVNKQYTSLAEHIMEAHSFIANPLHSLMEGPQFVAKLVRQLFPNDRALAIVAIWIIGII